MKARTNSWCAIWDWDGVVIDSSAHHRESWRRLAAENALMLPPDSFNRGFGMKNERIIPEILGWSQDPEEIARLCRGTARRARLLAVPAGAIRAHAVRPYELGEAKHVPS